MAQPRHGIDRSSPVPLYHQLEAMLRHEIEGGAYAVGDPLPSEGEIGDRYSVSRSVVRQTLTNLVDAGLIRTERGRGSFVAERKIRERFVQRAAGAYDDLQRMGHQISTRVLRQEIVALPFVVQEFLGTEFGVQIDRVRSIDGRTLVFIRSYLPEGRFSGIERADLTDASLYAHIEEVYGARPSTGRRTVEAVAVDDPIADHLGVPVGSPSLLLQSKTYDQHGEPLDWFDAWQRADVTKFEFEMVPGSDVHPINDVLLRAPAARRSSRGTAADAPVPAAQRGAARGAPIAAPLDHQHPLVTLRATSYQRLPEILQELAHHGFSVVVVSLAAEDGLAAVAEAAGADGIVVGAGDVTSQASARAAVDAGAAFIVANVGCRSVIDGALVPVMATAFTPAEIALAGELTHQPVLVHPASMGGPAYVRTVAASLPDVVLIPTGGVALGDTAAFHEAGASAVDLAEEICPASALESGDVVEIAARARKVRAALDAHRPASA